MVPFPLIPMTMGIQPLDLNWIPAYARMSGF